ncbi:hypothetical protein [Nocardia gipuzkoensis]|uniref:hypothetical protein n=1 Tax=Nocardia gipuzkoensis TaxID=2749991 RepID=UPI00237D6B47|nr:hypothetical protein [Nocardia gipuzkoensis]MDE1669963.1 hypothetical protein [Nocardia gipuzkoensis]
MIFLNSWILDVGESPAALLAQTPGEPGEGLLGFPDADGRLRLDPDDARAKLYGDVEERNARCCCDPRVRSGANVGQQLISRTRAHADDRVRRTPWC